MIKSVPRFDPLFREGAALRQAVGASSLLPENLGRGADFTV
jgi:hypothetical protein